MSKEESLEEKYQKLLFEVTRFSKVRQELVLAKQQIDLELERYSAISEFNNSALQLNSFAEVRDCALEAIIEAYQLEFSLYFELSDNNLVPVTTFGLDLEKVGNIQFDNEWFKAKKSILIENNHPLIKTCDCLDIHQAVIGGIFDEKEKLTGVIISGITLKGSDFYDELSESILNAYSVMLQQIGAIHHMFHVNEKLEIKVQERTAEVVRKKEEITDSINYAFRIQNSILGDVKEIEKSFNDSFIFFRPKDIVSGDFYWYSSIKSYKIIIAADCTGHGVPGAIMTVLGNALLNEIVNEHLVVNPGKILTILDKKIRSITQKQGQQVDDGMDMSVLVFDEDYQIVRFAGAKNPLIYIRDNEIIKIKGSRDAIGGLKNYFEFETHQIDFQKNDMFYIFSDGFQDQFCKNDAKKYKTKRFYQLLQRLNAIPCQEQKDYINNEFISWKGDTEQTDDVLVIGIKT